jgi:hypothetical protein
MSEILRFITGLRVRLILSSEESKSLEELLFENRYQTSSIVTIVITYELSMSTRNIRRSHTTLIRTDLNSSLIDHYCNMWYLQHPSVRSLFSRCERF